MLLNALVVNRDRVEERKLSATVVPVPQVSVALASSMFDLYSSYYDSTSRELDGWNSNANQARA